jgi:hypothetical protein
MIDATLKITTGAGQRTVDLASYLEPVDEEAAHRDANSWIKELRHARVEGRALRQRFTMRGDSLWWFTEIYLHKQSAALAILSTAAATRTLIERERPTELTVETGSVVARHVVPQVASSHGVRTSGGVSPREWTARLRRLRRRASGLTAAAWASRLKSTRVRERNTPLVAAFIHRAFWRGGGEDGSAEAYIGPVLKAIEDRAGNNEVRYVGIGPPVNFRARRWWTPFGPADSAVVPIERYAPWRALRDSRQIWRSRAASFKTLCDSDDVRRAAIIDGVDCWPIVREELAGVTYLQWPWSARAMDEAAAALDTLRPSVVLTYAEAGGWGRALVLEARRRGIPSAGLQHGFIYRHWLNYRHEPDEMQPGARGDQGFPAPTITTLFDEYAAGHLLTAGHFGDDSLRVTGSPRLDALVASVSQVDAQGIERIRETAGAGADDALILVTTKEREARQALRHLFAAASTLPGIRVIVKPHPAETPAAYAELVSGLQFVRVFPADAPLAPLLAASRAVVTVNSTVALDAALAGVPALVIGLPNNLSPFVEAGALAGATTPAEMAGQLQRVLYDEEFRQRLSVSRGELLGSYAMKSDGLAAQRSADAVLSLTARRPRPPARID